MNSVNLPHWKRKTELEELPAISGWCRQIETFVDCEDDFALFGGLFLTFPAQFFKI